MGNFILVMGLSGSGKSYWVNDIVEEGNTIALSSDALRKEFYGDERIQDNPTFIFEQMRIRTLQALKEGKNVAYDATNLSSKRRKALLRQLPKDVYKICHCIITPLEKGNLGENAHYYNHENVSAYLYMVSRAEESGYENRENIYNDLFIAWLINNHMIIWNNQKKYNSFNEHIKHLLKIFSECDKEGA